MTDILHCFADHGVESETLSNYGDVIRVGINPRDTNDSEPIQADANQLPFADDTQFDFGLFHPPCTKWSDMPGANKNGEAKNLIPLSRTIADQYCKYWVIENKPKAPLNDATVLSGKMFGLPIAYDRAFESNFQIEQPPRQAFLPDTETSTFFYSSKTIEWWASIKGVSSDYTKHSLSKNSLPSAYIHHIMRSFLTATDNSDGVTDYSNYDKRMITERREIENQSLEVYNE
jgi:hypothetical protein